MEEEKGKERSKEEREGEDDQEGIGIIKREKGSLIKEEIERRRPLEREVFLRIKIIKASWTRVLFD